MSLPGYAAADATAEAVRERLPSALLPFLDTSFVRSDMLYGEFVYRLVLEVLRRIEADIALEEPHTVPELVERAKLAVDQASVPLDWMLRVLAARGDVQADDGVNARYRLTGPLRIVDAAPIREEQRRIDPSWMPAYVLAETVAREYPAFLRGQVSGEDVLFSARRLRLWLDYFSNDHALYAINNRVGALAVEQWLPAGPTAILELGGGLGSGAQALLERLEATGRLGDVTEYRFTELIGAFLRRGEQSLRARHPTLSRLRFETFDINEPFEAQGVRPHTMSLVYAVNTLHVAHDLEWTLRQVSQSLAPGGLVVVSECIRPSPGQPVDAEFVFNLTETFRAPRLHPLYRPTGGFLTPEQWRAAFEAAGFIDVRIWPDVVSLRTIVSDFTVGAIGGVCP